MIAIREIDNDESTARRASTSFRNTGVCEFETLRQSISRIEKGLGAAQAAALVSYRHRD